MTRVDAYLFSIAIVRGCESVTLAYNGRVFAPSNGIHFPVSVVIVKYMDKTISAPWHPLD
jgi:hypothetical protein